MPTGYLSGKIQTAVAMVKNKLYESYHSEILESLPASYIEIGQVLKEDSEHMPTENYESCHVKVGAKIYAGNE